MHITNYPQTKFRWILPITILYKNWICFKKIIWTSIFHQQWNFGLWKVTRCLYFVCYHWKNTTKQQTNQHAVFVKKSQILLNICVPIISFPYNVNAFWMFNNKRLVPISLPHFLEKFWFSNKAAFFKIKPNKMKFIS